MIKIKWTDEISRLADSGRYTPGVVEEILDIVERDLNARQEIIDAGGQPITNGCIEDVDD